MSHLKLENMFQNLPSIYFRAKLHHFLHFKHCSGWSYQAQPSLPETDHWYHGLKRLTIDQINKEELGQVPVEDCAGYMFHLQIYGGSKVSSNSSSRDWITFQKIGELASISLPALANLPTFVPAPVTSVVAVSYRWYLLIFVTFVQFNCFDYRSLMQNVPFSPLSLCHILTPKTGFSRPSQIKKYPVHVRPRATIKHARRAKIFFGTLSFLSDPGIPGPIYGSKSLKLCNRPC